MSSFDADLATALAASQDSYNEEQAIEQAKQLSLSEQEAETPNYGDLLARIRELELENDQLRHERDQVINDSYDLEEQIAGQKTVIDSLHANLDSAGRTIKSLQREVEDLKDYAEEQEHARRTAVKKVENQEHGMTVVKIEDSDLSAENTILKNEVARLTKESEYFRTQYEQADEQARYYGRQMSLVKQENLKLEESLDTIRSALN